MNRVFIYYIKSKNILTITAIKVTNSDYHELINFFGDDYESTLNRCKAYCIGFINGNKASQKGFEIKSDVHEFI